MSYRELRNFTEAMRALGYPRLISVENFRTPNFDLMADILQINKLKIGNTTEADRVAFVKSVASAVHAKAQIKLNTKKLYSSDGYAVQELLKLATLLHAAAKESSARSRTASEDPDSEIAAPLVLSGEERQIRSLGVEVTGMGATIHSLLVVEPELRDARMKAITRLLDSDDVERDIKRTINTINSQMKELADNLENLAADEANLETKIERKKTDLERGQNRLKSLQSVRPPFMDEYERLEVELKKLYKRFRNVEYLENELEKYNREEQEKLEESEKVLKHMQTRIREEEMTMLREGKASSLGHRNDNFDSDEDEEDQAPERMQTTQNGRGGRGGGTIVARGGVSRVNSNNNSNNNKNRQNDREERGRTSGGGRGRVMGSMNGGEETESEEDDEIEGDEEGSSPEISLDSDNGDDDDDDFDDNEF